MRFLLQALVRACKIVDDALLLVQIDLAVERASRERAESLDSGDPRTPARKLVSAAGIAGFALWACTEAGQQTLTLFAFDKWRAAYFTTDAATQAIIRTNVAMYFLLLIGFSIGNLTLGLALVRIGTVLTRIVGYFLLAAVAITLPIISGELQWWTLPELIGKWSYPAIQPLGRVLIGLWLWRAANEDEALP